MELTSPFINDKSCRENVNFVLFNLLKRSGYNMYHRV